MIKNLLNTYATDAKIFEANSITITFEKLRVIESVENLQTNLTRSLVRTRESRVCTKWSHYWECTGVDLKIWKATGQEVGAFQFQSLLEMFNHWKSTIRKAHLWKGQSTLNKILFPNDSLEKHHKSITPTAKESGWFIVIILLWFVAFLTIWSSRRCYKLDNLVPSTAVIDFVK